MFSTINWTNRNDFSGPGDNRFDDVFGTLQNQAIAVVDAAINFWARTIADFNYGGGLPNVYNISVSMNATAMGSGPGGIGANGGFDGPSMVNGKPANGSMGIGWRSGITPTTNSSSGWYLDPTPMESSEFQGAFSNAFVRAPTGGLGGADMFTVILHELGHAVGFGSNTWTRAVSFDTNDPDTVSSPATTPGSTLWAGNFNNSLWTEFDSGGATGTPQNFNGPQHFAPVGTTANVFGIPRVGAAALMNSFVNNRAIISDIEADFLRFAFGYTIAAPSQFGTTYGQLDSNGTLRIDTTSLGNSADSVDIRPVGGNLQVTINTGLKVATIDPALITSNFPTASVQNIQINTGDGDDFVRVFPNGNIPVTVNGGNGNDTLEARGAPNAYDNFAMFGSSLTASGVNLASRSSFEAIQLWPEGGTADLTLTTTGGSSVTVYGSSSAETINLRTLAAGTPFVIWASGGNDVINIQTDFGSGLVASPVTVNGSDGDDTVNVGPVSFAGTLVTQPVTFNGGNDSDALVLGSDNADSVAATMSFNGESGTDDRVVYNDTAVLYTVSYDVRPTYVNRVGVQNQNVNFTQTDRIVINCGGSADNVLVRNGVTPTVEAFGNGGNDNFTRGDGMISATSVANFNGGPGVDTITFDDHLNPGNIIIDCREGQVNYAGFAPQFTTGFETVGVLAGTGVNEITFAGTLYQNFVVDSGDGADQIILGWATTGQGSVNFQGSASVTGGDAQDTFTINDVSTGGSPVTIDGGNSLNHMIVNHSFAFNYSLKSNEISLNSVFFPLAIIGLTNIESAAVYGNSNPNTFDIFGASSFFGTYDIYGNGGADTFNCFATENTFNVFDNLRLFGGPGTDAFNFVATYTALPRTYILANNWISIPAGIISDDIFISTDVENVTVSGGTGDDLFRVDQYSAGSALQLNGGEGNDTADFGNNDLAANITNMASFLFNGNEGFDTFNFRNANSTSAFTYPVPGNTTLQASRVSPSSYFLTLENYNVDVKAVYAGSAVDVMNITAFASGRLDFHGGDGDDALNLPTSSDFIGRPVHFYGDGGATNRINQITNSKTAGSVLHVDQNTIGAAPGDDFFAPGGYVYFDAVQLIQLRMGSGEDTAYMQPNAVASISINGAVPSSLPGDTLNLALANAQNYVINGTLSNGNVTSDNLQPLSWVNFETGPNVDDVAPYSTAQLFEYDVPVQRLSFEFNEDVSSSINAAWLELTNTTTSEQIPYANIAVTFDTGTNTAKFTFPGYANGYLPDGNYHARIAAGLPDAYGNAMTSDATHDFYFLTGDANHDAVVDTIDFNTLAANFSQNGTFSMGDFNYDGVIDTIDFNLLAGNFAKTLPAPAAAKASSPFSRRAVGADDEHLVALI